ncbi:MAG: tetratricopeptide repeat protein [Patescibacteria group bacterium]
MFLIIPLTIFAIATGTLVWVVNKKMPDLRRLEVHAGDLHKPFFRELFPEAVDAVGQIDARSWREQSLRELEKILRWLRLALTKIVSASDTLIHRVRQEHIHSRPLEDVVEEMHEEKKSVPTHPVIADNPILPLRQREQELIEAIAQNPRDSQLYKEIGDLYAKLKNYKDAKEAYATVLKLTPDDTAAEKKLSQVLKQLPQA